MDFKKMYTEEYVDQMFDVLRYINVQNRENRATISYRELSEWFDFGTKKCACICKYLNNEGMLDQQRHCSHKIVTEKGKDWIKEKKKI